MTLVMVWSNGSVVKYLLREKEKVKNKQCRYDSRISVPGAFNLDHLEPFEPVLNQLYLTPNLNHVKAHFLSLREGREGRQMISNYLHNTTIALVMAWSNGSVVKCLFGEMREGNTIIADKILGFQFPGHSNWTMC